MKNKQHNPKARLGFLSWLFIPIIVTWLGLNYIIGQMMVPDWESEKIVLGQSIMSDITGTPAPTSSQTMRFFRNPVKGFITFWFDDAWLSQYELAVPVLEPRGYKASLAVPTKSIGNYNYMTWNHVQHLQTIGWEITSHSRSHNCDVTKLSVDDLISETYGARADLVEQGFVTTVYVTPCSSDSQELINYIKKFYLGLRTGEGGINPVPVIDQYHILAYGLTSDTTISSIRSWIKNTEESKGWLILMFHQIDDSGEEYAVTPGFFHAIVDEVTASTLTVALPSEVLSIVDSSNDEK
jgi:hypothetical protein